MQASAGVEIPVQRCIPLGTVELIVQINLKPCTIMDTDGVYRDSAGIYFTGLYTDAAFWKPSTDNAMFGIRLKPESLIELFKLPANLLVNKVINAEDLLGKSVKLMCDEMTGIFDVNRLIQIAEKYLLALAWNIDNRHNYVVGACRLIRNTMGSLSVESMSERLYISKRQLERCFKDQFGTSPKTYQRIIRFRNAYTRVRLARESRLRWTEISYAAGYADQAHFIRDFKAFTGELPTTLVENTDAFFQTLEVSAAL
ncbi:hypothetical protein GCM10023149_23040 [Mucilaginibacter gynuensis]|uniref:HTH araC/xylS-type domain-containing protein n=2 Tax=Mucilaginibacter gynuensis TaxID=1302236 RepID=A0ABP8GE23_9SPHI